MRLTERRVISEEEVGANRASLQRCDQLNGLSAELLSQLSLGCYEELDEGIMLFRRGDIAKNFYLVINGTLEVLTHTGRNEEASPICSLAEGSIFGDAADSTPSHHSTTVVTKSSTALIRLDHHQFLRLWKRHADQLGPSVILLKSVAAQNIPEGSQLHTCLRSDSSKKSNLTSRSGDSAHIRPVPSTVHVSFESDRVVKTDNLPVPNQMSAERNGSAPEEELIPGAYSYSLPLFQSSPPTSRHQRVPHANHHQSHERIPHPTDIQTVVDPVDNGGYDSEPTGRSNVATPEQHNDLRHAFSSVSVFMDASPVKSGSDLLGGPFRDSDKLTYAQRFLQATPSFDQPDSNGLTGDCDASVCRSISNLVSVQAKMILCGKVLATLMYSRTPHLIRDRKYNSTMFRRCMIGTEMVDWLLQQANGVVHSRTQAVGMWQSLLEEGVLTQVSHEHPFLDKYLFYRWSADDSCDDTLMATSEDQQAMAEADLPNVLNFLATIGPDALFRMILQKAPIDRSPDDLEVIYEELLHIKALSHLSTMVKRELASVLMYEQHSHAGTVLFNQGESGKSWYIILKGSVDVLIFGKGVVCTLHEGDDFGKLALVNDAPRAASIILREDNCQFLRVDKQDFNRILRDVEANTVRLKEHGQDVLVLEKIPIKLGQDSPGQHRYSVMAGSPEKMLEYLLETRIDSQTDESVPDTFLEDFLLTHLIFMPTNILCNSLMVYYQQGCSAPGSSFPSNDPTMSNPTDLILTAKRRVVSFLHSWACIAGFAFFQDPVGAAFVEELYCATLDDIKTQPSLKSDLALMERLMQGRDAAMRANTRRPMIVLDCGNLKQDRVEGCANSPAIMPFDLSVFKVFSSDRTYTTFKVRMDKTVAQIRLSAAHKLGMGRGEGIELVEIRSNGDKMIFHSDETSVPTMMTLNGRLVVVFRDQIDSLVPLPEQDGPDESLHIGTLELLNSGELALHLALLHWELFCNTHEYEFIYQVIGRDKFGIGRICSNLDILMRRFNEVQNWVATEVVLCQNLSKRVYLIKKFIKIAALSKNHQDLLSFFAIILGLSNVAVSRLTATWDKLPNKFRKQFLDFESYLDPSRNHRPYRLMMNKLRPPIIPFIPLLMKDLTFTHDGNKTYFDGLVNFEKMHMIAQTLRTIRHCKSRPFPVDQSVKKSLEAQQLVRNFKVIDNQRRLTALSHRLEPRKM